MSLSTSNSGSNRYNTICIRKRTELIEKVHQYFYIDTISLYSSLCRITKLMTFIERYVTNFYFNNILAINNSSDPFIHCTFSGITFKRTSFDTHTFHQSLLNSCNAEQKYLFVVDMKYPLVNFLTSVGFILSRNSFLSCR